MIKSVNKIILEVLTLFIVQNKINKKFKLNCLTQLAKIEVLGKNKIIRMI